MKQLEIYGTLGPSCCTKEILQKMLKSGMTGIRLNLSHSNLWDRKDWISAFHDACAQTNLCADFMIDLHGPELRTCGFSQPINLIDHTEVLLDHHVLPELILEHAQTGDFLLMDDGKIRCSVINSHEQYLQCQVVHGGLLKPGKSIHIEGKTILGPTLTESDLENLRQAKQFGVNAVMQPFVSFKEDLIQVRETLKQLGAEDLKIYAKIENRLGVQRLEELIPYCDCVVIARGDLGNAVGLVELPKIQKTIENICHQHHHPYMVVTEMLNSMIDHPTPTRAEVSDVFHAVYHGADAIMLTGETASGKYPVEAMSVFTQVARQALDEINEKEKEND